MAKSLNQILGYETQLGIVEDIKAGVPNVLPPGFFSPRQPVEGNRGSYLRVEGTRETARAVLYGSPSARREQEGISEQSVTLVNLYEHIAHKPELLNMLKAEDNPGRQARGKQEVERQTAHFFTRFSNWRVAALMSALAKGAIYLDSDGNLLPSSSGARDTADFGISANHKNQLNGIIGASWATDGTDILGDIVAIQKQCAEDWGGELKYAIYGSNIPEYIGSNTLASKFIAGSASMSEQMVNGKEIPNGFGGLTWIPGYKSMYKDNDGTYQYWLGADTVVFTPEAGAEWLGWLEGSYLVPTDVSVTGSVEQALDGMAEVTGFFSWCLVDLDLPGITQKARDLVLPVIKAPSAIFIADVTP